MPSPYSGVARLRIMGRIHGQQTVNVLHFGTNIAVFDATNQSVKLNELIAAILDCIRTTLLPALPLDWNLERVTAQAIHPAASDEVEVAAVGTDIGGGSDSDVSFASQLLSIKTGQGGLRKRGRIFMPPPPEGGVTQSRLTGPQLALIAAFAACLASKFIAGGAALTEWRLAVLSRTTLAAAGGTVNNSITEATSVTATNIVAVLGRRKVGRGS